MSVIELPMPQEPAGPDRTPPNDHAAEQSVLGAMLLSKDAIADVVEVLREGDFYRPVHQTIYGAIIDLYGRGEPADAVTVAAELTKTGDIGRIGGAPYLHTLVSMVPTAANANYYGRIVREQAILRRLVEAGTRIVHMGYTGTGDVDDLVDRAQAEVYDVTDKRTAEDYSPLREIMNGALTEIEAISNRGGEMVGVPTGFSELDRLTNGLHPGQLVILAARPAIGKALALDTPLPTPSGWTTQGAVRPGDRVLAADGTPTRVRAVSEIWIDRPCFEVVFSDGSSIVADAEHEWLTLDESDSSEGIRVTSSIRGHRIANASALCLPPVQATCCPYTAGVRAAIRVLNLDTRHIDPEIAMYVEGEGHSLSEPNDGAEFAYLRGSREQRQAVLAGILDVAGHVTHDGTVVVKADRSADRTFVKELAAGLGLTCRQGVGDLHIETDGAVFRLERKVIAHKERTRHGSDARRRSQFIVDVRPVSSVPVRCIEIEHPSHLYLAGRSMIPTHNSTLGVDIARAASIKHGLTSVIFSLEMSRNEIVMRLLSAEAQIPLHHMRSGTMSDADWTKLVSKMGAVSEAPLFIDDSPNMTLMEIRAKCRRLKQRHDLRLVVVDYLQLMTSGKRVESRQQEVSEFSRSLKLLAKELEVPVIAISQLNRGPEQRTDKRPMLSDLRESGSLEQDADMVVLLHREDAYEKESPRAGEADFIVAKHRNGPTATVTVAFQGHYSRFVDMAQS